MYVSVSRKGASTIINKIGYFQAFKSKSEKVYCFQGCLLLKGCYHVNTCLITSIGMPNEKSRSVMAKILFLFIYNGFATDRQTHR